MDVLDSHASPESIGTRILDQLARSFSAVGGILDHVRQDSWSAPTPCTDWAVRDVASHLHGMNLVFSAILRDEPLSQRGETVPDVELPERFHRSSEELLAAFAAPGVLECSYEGPLGVTTGIERARIRRYDLVAHAWDLEQATSHPLSLPESIAEECLAFARKQLTEESRPGRFAPAQHVPEGAPSIDRLAGFPGRTPFVREEWRSTSGSSS